MRLPAWRALGWRLWATLGPFGNTSLAFVALAADVISSRRTFERVPALLRIPLAGTLVAMWISAFVSPRPWVSLATAFAFSCLWYLIGASYSYFRDEFYVHFRIFTFSAALASALAILGWFLLGFERTGIGGLGFVGLGMTSILTAGIGVSYLHSQRSRWWLAYLVVVISALLLTFTRGAWLGFIMMLLLYAWSVRREYSRASWTFLSVIGAFVLLVLLVPELREYVILRFADGDNSRFGIWKTTINIIRHNPVLGVGPGVHPIVYNDYLVPGAMPDAGYAHNLVLAVLADLGIVGGLPFLAVFCVVVYSAFKLLRSGDFRDRGLGAGLIGVFVHFVVDIPIYGVEIGGLFWILAALACIRAEVMDEERLTATSAARAPAEDARP